MAHPSAETNPALLLRSKRDLIGNIIKEFEDLIEDIEEKYEDLIEDIREILKKIFCLTHPIWDFISFMESLFDF
ncbi:hypothetical protein ACS0PU_010623 [Formica fusca]